MKWIVVLLATICCVGVVSATELNEYGNVTTFTQTVTARMDTQTNYHMKFILSNASGVSGYYPPDNVIFTNGTTRPDWFDINATDSSNTPLSFWVENRTQTARNATVWVNVPSITVAGTQGKWYYGNSSQSASTMNGTRTFPLFADWGSESTLNTTEWKSSGTGSEAVLNGAFNVTGGAAAWRFENSITTFGYNYSVRSLSAVSQDTAAGWAVALSDGGVGNNQVSLQTNSVPQKRYDSVSGGTQTDAIRTSSIITYTVLDISRTLGNQTATTALAKFSENNAQVAQISTNVPSISLNATLQARQTTTSLGTRWLFVRKALGTEPTTSDYSTTSPMANPLNASFTNLPNPSSAGNVVTFTDTSDGNPVTWNWSVSGVLTNSTQNAAYKFTTPGSYPIWLNATNATGYWSNASATQVVTNATEFIPLDIWMEGAYLTTWHITDSATGAPIPAVTITDSHSQQFDTTNGTGYLTEEFGSTTFYFASDGYTSRALTYFIDEDREIDVQLTKAEPGGQQNVWYTPWQVRFRIVDYYSKPLPGTNVTAQYIAATLPSTDPSWLVSAFGISSDVAGDMLNSSVAMQGDTDDNGGLSFTMFKSLQYRLTITNTTSGVSSTKTIYPTDPEYVIYVRTTGQQAVNNTLTSVVSSSLPFYKLNTSCYNLSVIYQDATGQTTNVVFTVKDWTHSNTVVYTKNLGYPGLGIVTDNYTACIPLGQEYIWNYNATKV